VHARVFGTTGPVINGYPFSYLAPSVLKSGNSLPVYQIRVQKSKTAMTAEFSKICRWPSGACEEAAYRRRTPRNAQHKDRLEIRR
jgi:hypothetical protein